MMTMPALTDQPELKEDRAAELGAKIRLSMTSSAAARSQDDIARLSQLIEQRIKGSYERGLLAALGSKPKK